MTLVAMLFALVIGLTASWLIALVALSSSTSLQRHVFYAHKAPIWWRQKLHIPESFGFCRHQAAPVRIPAAGGVSLFAWLIAPLEIYSAHGEVFHTDPDAGLKFLLEEGAKLVLYFHGVAGTVAQTRRTDAYRMIGGTGAWVLAIDYRGFGLSTGSPDESGLIQDALAVIRWAREAGKVPTERITLVAQSLGTAVVAGALNVLVDEEPDVAFAGVVLCASFVDAPSMFISYKILGASLLAPLHLLPPVKRWFTESLRDKWQTKQRLERWVKETEALRLTLVASTCDEVSPWRNTEDNFYACATALAGRSLRRHDVDEASESVDLHDAGSVQEWSADSKRIRKVIVQYGGHNGIMKWCPVALEVSRLYRADQERSIATAVRQTS